jgi:ATP-binding cassette subfamily B protein
VFYPAIEGVATLATALIIVVGGGWVGTGTLTLGALVAFLQYAQRFFRPISDMSEKFNVLQGAMASSERIFALLDTPVAHENEKQIPRGVYPEERRDERARDDTRPGTKGVTIEFEDVWFAYASAHRAAGDVAAEPEWVLRGVTFRVRPGETLALVGHTGAGKTTIVNLLLRFYDPQRGRILIDGVDIREMPVGEVRSLIGYVQQDIFLFAGDVATNIRLSNPLSREAVALAAKRVGADRIIDRLPNGYDQVLAERGASISVGERQLLSVARAIAADPAVLVLDEATSAVDSEIELEIQRALRVLMEGRTTIAIAHRLSTIVGADEILVLHHGQVRERGRHGQLMARGGLYERLYRLQMGAPQKAPLAAASRLPA